MLDSPSPYPSGVIPPSRGAFASHAPRSPPAERSALHLSAAKPRRAPLKRRRPWSRAQEQSCSEPDLLNFAQETLAVKPSLNSNLGLLGVYPEPLWHGSLRYP